MATGPLDHPTYLTRQTLLITPNSTAGANTVQTGGAGVAFPFDIRIRNAVAVVQTAGTSAGAASGPILYTTGTSFQFPDAVATYGTLTVNPNQIGTTTNTTTATLGQIALGSAAAGSYGITGDMNARIPAGQALFVKNATDATGRYSLAIEYHLDPVSAAWTGSN